jgi:hypothetical protein
MPFKRSMLESKGIEPAVIDEIMAAHVGVIDTLKDERDKLQADIAEAQRQLSNSQGEAKNWQTKYESEHTAFEEFKTSVAEDDVRRTKETAYREALVKAGVPDKVIPAILRVADLSPVEIGEDGAAKDADKLLETAKSTWADFIPVSGEKRDVPDNPPDNAPTGKEAFEAMTLSQKMQYANAHPEEVAAYLK